MISALSARSSTVVSAALLRLTAAVAVESVALAKSSTDVPATLLVALIGGGGGPLLLLLELLAVASINRSSSGSGASLFLRGGCPPEVAHQLLGLEEQNLKMLFHHWWCLLPSAFSTVALTT